MTIRWNTSAQGTDEWLAARKGLITASRFKDCRDKLKSGELSAKAKLYAQDIARERVGGTAASVYVNAAMRFGTEQEPLARVAYEDHTGHLVEQVGFAFTEDRKFGGSVDGLIDAKGIWECKAMVSSDTLFKAVVEGDISEYRDQCNGGLWLLGRQWVDLTLWAPDLRQPLHVIRINRDDNEIQRLEDDLMAFERLVCQYEVRLRAKLGHTTAPWADTPKTNLAAAAADASVVAAF